MANLVTSTKDGRPLYRVRWNHRTDRDGKRRFDERRFRKLSDALRLQRDLTAAHNQTTETITVRELAARWFNDHVDQQVSLRTRKDYHCHFAKRIDPCIGSKRVAQLSTKALADWRNSLTVDVGAPTVNKTLDTLRAMIRWGRSEGLCTNTMIDDVRRVPQRAPKPARAYTPAQVAAIADGCEFLRERTLVLLAAYSGLRWSELRALRWTDINLDRAEITLSRALDLDKSFKSTKSNRVRIVAMMEPAVDALRLWRDEVPQNADLVFATSTGRPLGENGWYSQRLPKIREACGLHFDLHELRDTYASLLIAAGIEIAEIKMWLGHTSIETTLARYGQLFDQRKTSLVSKANALIPQL